MQLQFRGQRMSFSTGTGNREAAARIAANIYTSLLSDGVSGTLAKYRTAPKPEDVASLGDWIAAAERVFDKSPATFASYARAARTIAGDIVSAKRTSKRFGRKGGSFRRDVDLTAVSIFTSRAVQEWKIRYVAERGTDPARQRAARISCNYLLRSARSLFGDRIAKHLPPLEMEERPFAKVAFYPRESMKYHSKIDPQILLTKAREELTERAPESLKILLLALGAGLRRGEIDRLLWRQIDLEAGEIHVEVTEAGGLKSADSSGIVAIDETLCGILRGFKARASSQYVIEGEGIASGAKSWGQQYRCAKAFDFLLAWLRRNGVEENKPLHTLRKEAGAMIATRSGIYAASRFLRHADIAVTSQHYADSKERISIDLGALLPAENVKKFAPPARAARKARGRKSA